MIAFKVFFALAFVVAAIFAAEEKQEKDLEAAGGHLLGYYGGLGYGAGLYGAGYGGYGLYGGYGRYGFGNGYGLGYGHGYGYGHGLYGR